MVSSEWNVIQDACICLLQTVRFVAFCLGLPTLFPNWPVGFQDLSGTQCKSVRLPAFVSQVFGLTRVLPLCCDVVGNGSYISSYFRCRVVNYSDGRVG